MGWLNAPREGRIEFFAEVDGFAPLLHEKIPSLGSTVEAVIFAPDDAGVIAEEIGALVAGGCDLLLVSGGMSVDPDDVTREGIARACADEIHYGAAALPGAMFLSARIGECRSWAFRPAPFITVSPYST